MSRCLVCMCSVAKGPASRAILGVVCLWVGGAHKREVVFFTSVSYRRLASGEVAVPVLYAL